MDTNIVLTVYVNNQLYIIYHIFPMYALPALWPNRYNIIIAWGTLTTSLHTNCAKLKRFMSSLNKVVKCRQLK